MNESKVDVTVRQERVAKIKEYRREIEDYFLKEKKISDGLKTYGRNFQDLINYLIEEYYEVTSSNALGMASGLTGDTVDSYRNGKSKPKSKKPLLAIISAIKMPPVFAYQLFRTLSWNLKTSVCEEDKFYCFLIDNFCGEGVVEWNCRILATGHPEWMIPENAKIEDYTV